MSASSGASDRRSRAPGLRWLLDGVNLPLALGGLALLAFAFRAGPYDLRLLSIVGIFSLMVIGFQFVFGYAGAVSLAQSCFFGVGAYVTGILGTRFGLDTALTLPLSIAAAAALAFVVAIPVRRLDDHYFALATLAVTLLGELVATQWEEMTGGTNGLSGIPPLRLFGWAVTDRFSTMVAVWIVVALGAGLALLVTRGLYGKGFHLLRESVHAAAALGLDVAQMRLAALVLSAAYAGAAGALMAHVVHVVSPEQVGLPLMVTCLTMTVIGGRMSLAGAIVGALLITYLRESFRVLEAYTQIAYAGTTLVFLVAAPHGLVGALERLRARWLRPREAAFPIARDGPARVAASASGVPLLRVDAVSKSFGGLKALDDVSLSLKAGEITGLIGPNGSGKTTLLNIISGLYVGDGGRVEILGKTVSRASPRAIARLGVSRTFQHIHLVDDMTILDNIALGRAGGPGSGLWASLRAWGRDDALAAARRAAVVGAATLGIETPLGVRCGDLPYGSRRRVEVARAFVTGARLLLLDEPAAGLNEEEQRDLARRIERIAQTGVTVLVVEHNLVFLAQLAERLICLDQGRVIADGPAAAVRADPKVVEAYLGSGA